MQAALDCYNRCRDRALDAFGKGGEDFLPRLSEPCKGTADRVLDVLDTLGEFIPDRRELSARQVIHKIEAVLGDRADAGHSRRHCALYPAAVLFISRLHLGKFRGRILLGGLHSRGNRFLHAVEFLIYLVFDRREFPACQIVKEGESCGVKSLYSFYRCCSDPLDAAAVFLVGPFHVAELFFYGRLGCAHHLADDIADCPEYLLCDLEGGTEFFFDPAENAVHQVSEPLAFVVKKDYACNQSNNADHDPGDRIGQQRRRKAPDRCDQRPEGGGSGGDCLLCHPDQTGHHTFEGIDPADRSGFRHACDIQSHIFYTADCSGSGTFDEGKALLDAIACVHPI